jgi:hypothetical protein
MISFSTTVLNEMLNEVSAAIDSNVLPGKLKVYSAPRPRTGEAITNQILLVEFTFADPSAQAADDANLLFSSISVATAVGEGVAVWCRATNGVDSFVFDALVGLNESTADVRINDTNIQIGNQVTISDVMIKVSE